MDKNMKSWMQDLYTADKKKALPILSFPCVSLLGVTVRDLIADSDLQAKGMKLIADRTDALASVSFMDLSVEAECFGATVHFANAVTDGGPIILQKAVDVREDDTPETLQRRIMEECEWNI